MAARENHLLERYFGTLKGDVKEAEVRVKKVRVETSECFRQRKKVPQV